MFSLCFLVALVCKSEEHFVRLSSCFTQSHILYMDKPLSAPRGPDDGGKKQKRPREASSGREGADKRGRRDGRRDGGRRGGGRGGGGGGRGDGPRHRGGRGGRSGGTGPRRAPDRDTVRFSYKWAVTPEKQRVPTGAESTSDRGAVASLRAHGMGPVRPDPIKNAVPDDPTIVDGQAYGYHV